jgi:hypothetical protein
LPLPCPFCFPSALPAFLQPAVICKTSRSCSVFSFNAAPFHSVSALFCFSQPARNVPFRVTCKPDYPLPVSFRCRVPYLSAVTVAGRFFAGLLFVRRFRPFFPVRHVCAGRVPLRKDLSVTYERLLPAPVTNTAGRVSSRYVRLCFSLLLWCAPAASVFYYEFSRNP